VRVLLVEDDSSICHTLTRALAEAGHEVRAMSSGTAAAAVLAGGFAPDAVVTDLGLPGLPGEQVARAARARTRALVVLISGDAVRLQEARPLAHAALLKPFPPEELLAALHRTRPEA
jgi:DNA-binding response OmpR family regulator